MADDGTYYDVEANGLPYYFIIEAQASLSDQLSPSFGRVKVNPLEFADVDAGGVRRMVLQAVPETAYAYEGERVTELMDHFVAWLKDFIEPGDQLTEVSTGKYGLLLVWNGLLNTSVQYHAVEYEFSTPIRDAYPLGRQKDPIPNVVLWKNPKVPWKTGPGGQGANSAMAWYDKAKGKLTPMTSQPKSDMIKRLMSL